MQGYFNTEVEGVGHKSFQDIFKSLSSGKVDYAIVPLENSLAGSIYDIYDLLWEHDCFAIGEHYYKVEHCLLGLANSVDKVKRVYSHPKALEQCGKFLDNYTDIEKIALASTADSAKYVAETLDPLLAAIAAKEAAELYNLKVLKFNLEDNPLNYTRFLILSASNKTVSSADKCSVIFTLPHEPQSLLKAMQAIAEKTINITKIESRPIHGKPFEYVFYIDVEYDSMRPELIETSLALFREKTNSYKVLGFYRKGRSPC